MSNFHDLDDVFDALRGPAMPAELADEANSADLMANAHLATKGKPMHSVSRRTRFATLVAAGVLGFGGAAAASGDIDLPGNSDFGKQVAAMAQELQTAEEAEEEAPEEEAPEQGEVSDPGLGEDLENQVPDGDGPRDVPDEDVDGFTDEPTPIEDPADEPEQLLALDEEPGDDADAEPGDEVSAVPEDFCLEEDKNHGYWVSSVARGLADEEGLGQFSVSEVAKSDCGKDFEDETEEEAETEESESESESEPDSDEEVEVEVEVETDADDSADEEEREESGRPDHAGPRKSSDSGDEVDVDADESEDDGPGKGKGGSNGKGKGGR